MLSEIKFEYPSWFLLLCVALGIVFALALYFRDTRFQSMPAWYRWVLSVLRALGVTALAVLLLSPLVKKTTEDVKQPIVVIAEDISKSIVAEKDDNQIAKARSDINTLASKLATQYDVKRIIIGDEPSETIQDSFTANSTNLSKALTYIDDNYGDQNLGAVILSTDGIYNEGKNPLYTSTNITAPIYSIAQGDTTQRRDILIKNVFANKIAYLGDKFTIQVDVSGVNASTSSTNLSVRKVLDNGSKKLNTERINIEGNQFFTTREITLSADQVGINRYRISLSKIANEASTTNNYKDIYIEVLDARQKIVLLANAPHPDIAALKQMLSKNKNYEVETAFVQSSDKINLVEYDLVVLHNLPSKKHDISSIQTQLSRRNTPTVYIVGAQTDPTRFNQTQDVLKINGGGNSLEYVEATIKPNFNSFIISPELSRTVGTFPPLLAPFGEYKSLIGANVLLTQKIKDIDTKYPLLAFGERGNRKSAVWVGEGIWKWRMFNFAQTENYDLIEELVSKTFQFVGTKADKRKFRASTAKNIYKENEEILFDAQLYNDNYEMINTPDVFLSIKNAAQKEYKFTFSKTNNYYTLNARILPPGKYTYTATTSYNGVSLSQKGYFSVLALQLESYDLTARHGLLRSLSEKYGGSMFMPDQTVALADTLRQTNALKPVVYTSTKTQSAINYTWIFWLLLLLFAAEWFLRRYWGSY